MKRYLLIIVAMMALFLAAFIIVESLGGTVLNDPTPWMNSAQTNSGRVTAALIGVGLLVADVLLPVPSSLVMVAHGALFGVWVGTLLSLTGSVGAALFGFAIGRRGEGALNKFVTDEERLRANALLKRWGVMAIVVTRPIPIVAETVAIVAGTSSLGWGSVAIASLAGSIPAALLYAITGAAIADLQSSTMVFGLVILIAVLIGLGSAGWKLMSNYRQSPE
ncbi:MAG TPA: VTT domain-containing protein [Pyrinomonadaceae bacterium]|jgi:uncharacterized membrane protein YdjX (TVP38/TMEM64 family)|nr:VTT domain-containing protein [Pyrinomonadaceae bacterium]